MLLLSILDEIERTGNTQDFLPLSANFIFQQEIFLGSLSQLRVPRWYQYFITVNWSWRNKGGQPESLIRAAIGVFLPSPKKKRRAEFSILEHKGEEEKAQIWAM